MVADGWDRLPSGVRLNELVVWNTSGVVSANGEYVDWIELYNENDHALDISGWTLTDDDTDTDKYMLPAGTVIGPQSYLLVYASTDNAPPTGELHTGFALDEVNGGYLGLFAPIGGTPTLSIRQPRSRTGRIRYLTTRRSLNSARSGGRAWKQSQVKTCTRKSGGSRSMRLLPLYILMKSPIQ